MGLLSKFHEFDHVFITVGKRRWCVCCDLFQQKYGEHDWPIATGCPNTAPAADENRRHEMRDKPVPAWPYGLGKG